MYSSLTRTRRSFTAALLVTVVLALAPQTMLRWTSDIAEIVRVPMRPFTHVGVRLGAWFRPPQLALEDVPEDARELVEHLQSEADLYKQLYVSEQMEVASLRQTLEQLQRVPREFHRAVHLLSASITARTPADHFAPVQLNRGTAHDVKVGAIALYDGVHLVGSIHDVTTMGSTLLPLVHRNTGLIQAVIAPPDSTELDKLPNVLLEANGKGAFSTDVDQNYNIQLGDVAMIADPKWPASSRGMTIGTVTDIVPLEDQPLRMRLVVTPVYQLHQLSRVTLKIEMDEPALAGALGGEDPP